MNFEVRSGSLLTMYYPVRNVEVNSTSLDWNSNGRIISANDLLGSQLIIEVFGDGFSNVSLFEVVNEIRLSGILIKIPSGIKIFLDKGNLKKIGRVNNKTYYSYLFPSSIETLINETEYNLTQSSVKLL